MKYLCWVVTTTCYKHSGIMHHKKALYKVLSFQGNKVVKWHFIIMMNGGMAKVESFSFNDPENGIHFSISGSDKWLECFFQVLYEFCWNVRKIAERHWRTQKSLLNQPKYIHGLKSEGALGRVLFFKYLAFYYIFGRFGKMAHLANLKKWKRGSSRPLPLLVRRPWQHLSSVI